MTHKHWLNNRSSTRIAYQFFTIQRAVEMHGVEISGTHIGRAVTRKVKISMMHVLDLLRGRLSNNAKKVAKVQQQQRVSAKSVLARKLTIEEQQKISDAELALERLQTEKKRLEEILNAQSDTHLPNDEVANNNNVRKELVRVPRYQQKVAFLLHNVFTSEECAQLLDELEVNCEDISKSDNLETCTTHSEAMAKRLWPVLEREVPKTWLGNSIIGLSDRCTLETQSKGYTHKPRMDEAYEPVEGKEKSFLSIYIFLNDDYEGGQSSFLKNWTPSVQDVKVKPIRGSVFVHQHNLLHETTPLVAGEKHIARMDIMYNIAKRDVLSDY